MSATDTMGEGDMMDMTDEQRVVAYLRALQNDAETATLDASAFGSGYREIATELARLQARNRELERNAYTDALTGVGSRAGFDRVMDRYWREAIPFTCAFIDIDHLKTCNDQFGHAEGNRYILSTCRMLTGMLDEGEMLFRIGGDEFILVSRTSTEDELTMRLEACRAALIASARDDNHPMVFSFSFGCSHADPAAGDTRRQMTLDADRKMYRYKLLHRVRYLEDPATPKATVHDTPFNDRIFQALSMTSESRYLFVINLDTTESQWSLNAVRDFNLPSEHPFNSIPMWLGLVHPDDRENVREELANIEDGTWHFHTMQYRVMSSAGKYVLCDCMGFRLDGTETEPTVYAGCIVNRSMAEVTDSVTGLGDSHALITALGQARRNANETGIIAVHVDDIAMINARFGYEAGDRVLSETAGCLVELSRAKARVFRGHGVTFVALFEEFDPADLANVEREIKKSIGSPILLGGVSYVPPIRVASMHFDTIETQPASIMTELHHMVHEAPQIPGSLIE